MYYGIRYDLSRIEGDDVTVDTVADLLADKKIIALFQGKSEGGPRALGNRSILYDPRDPDGQEKINNLKQREQFRPFAASILFNHVKEWFLMDSSPHMCYAVDARLHTHNKIPAVLHHDYTSRIQTVTHEENPRFHDLISRFFGRTSVPMVLNTSFNIAGDPLVETPDQALDTLKKSEIDYVYFPEINKLVGD